MTAGSDLKEGKYDQTLKSPKEIRKVFTIFFENSSKKASTYKYAMFKCIMDCLPLITNKTYRISFDLLFNRFSEIYWILVFKHKIPQKAPSTTASVTLAEKVISTIVGKYKIRKNTKYADLTDSIRLELIYQMKTKCSRYVFGALYADTERIFYSFSKDGEWIRVNPQIAYYFNKHGNAIQKQNYEAWGNYYIEIGVNNGKGRGYYQRLLKREFGDNAVLPIKFQAMSKKSLNQGANKGKDNDVAIANKLRTIMAQYPDLGLYLRQICEQANLDKDKAKKILDNSYWCRKEGSRYYYINISYLDFVEDTLIQEDAEDDENQTKEPSVDLENIMLLSDPEKLIKKLIREKEIEGQIDNE